MICECILHFNFVFYIVHSLNISLKMFSNITNDFHLNVESLPILKIDFRECDKLTEQTREEYETIKHLLNETNSKISCCEEELSSIEKERVNLMSELALQMQTKHDLQNKVESLKNSLQSIEFEIKKYSKMKASSTDLDALSHLKKTFVTYKNMLKIMFDYSNGPNAVIQKGYMYNKATMKLTYFEFNTEEKSADKITRYLWDKMLLVSEQNWKSIC
ncbi:uncharacterized protein LOC126834673 [Adelges cooleyi]|uniref:uncharacterized protein LOC126834673 n=1 Tax=Adelges cooleyi TaxID=133065 RepID=UPI00217FADD7|nr:uncharacterized protein LOC126834673 [Adelges cooleyi]